MHLRWIKLSNIRSYESAEVDFSSGTTLLAGDIGSGKSTILLSIEFALFGLIKGELSGNSLLRNGKVKGSVELCLNVDDKEVIIKRMLKKSNSSITQDECYIIINGVKKDASPVEVKSKVIELLGYPEDMITKKNLLYRYTVYTPQEEMKRIIFEDKEERLNTLRKVFGIDKYKTIRENAILFSRKLKEECKLIEGRISDLEQKKQDIEKIKEGVDSLRKELEPIRKDKEELQGILTKKEKEYKEIKIKNEECVKLKSLLSTLEMEHNQKKRQIQENESIIATKEKEIGSASLEIVDTSNKELLEKEIEAEENIIVSLKEKTSSILEREKNCDERISSLKMFIDKNKERLKETDILKDKINQIKLELADKDKTAKESEEITKKLLDIERNISALEERSNAARDAIGKINSLNDCPLCLQKVDHEHKKSVISKENKSLFDAKSGLEKYNKDKAELTLKVAEWKGKAAQFEKKDKELKAHELSLNSLKSIEEQISEKNNELNSLIIKKAEVEKDKREIEKSNITEMQKKLALKKEQKKRIDEFLAKLNIIEEKKKMVELLRSSNSKLEKSIAETAINIEKAKSKINFYGDIEQKLNAEEKQLSELKEKAKSVDVSIMQKETMINAKEDEKGRINKEISGKEEEKKKLYRKRQYISWIENSFMNVIAIIEKNILSQVYNEFNEHFQEWFDTLLEDELVTAKLDDEFSPSVQQNGYDIDISNMSGGEKTALALAYRLALNKVITDISNKIRTKDIIILDEPTDGFSEQQLDKMRDVLLKLEMGQIIIVSHENKIESFVDKIVKISKEGHISSVASQ
jgi:exonuclease SbcC